MALELLTNMYKTSILQLTFDLQWLAIIFIVTISVNSNEHIHRLWIVTRLYTVSILCSLRILFSNLLYTVSILCTLRIPFSNPLYTVSILLWTSSSFRSTCSLLLYNIYRASEKKTTLKLNSYSVAKFCLIWYSETSLNGHP